MVPLYIEIFIRLNNSSYRHLPVYKFLEQNTQRECLQIPVIFNIWRFWEPSWPHLPDKDQASSNLHSTAGSVPEDHRDTSHGTCQSQKPGTFQINDTIRDSRECHTTLLQGARSHQGLACWVISRNRKNTVCVQTKLVALNAFIKELTLWFSCLFA